MVFATPYESRFTTYPLRTRGRRTWIHVAKGAPDAGARAEARQRAREAGGPLLRGRDHPGDAHVT